MQVSANRLEALGHIKGAVAGCVDLDLSFTPATNLLPLRRLDLRVGQAAGVRSAWLEWPAAVLTPLIQRYSRRSLAEYDYEADLPGTAKVVGVLRVEPHGLVLDCAGLWQAEAAAPHAKSHRENSSADESELYSNRCRVEIVDPRATVSDEFRGSTI